MDSPADQHRAAGPPSVACAVLTVSDTRTAETDRGGDLVVELLTAAGHSVAARRIVPDDPAAIQPLLVAWIADASVEAIVLTGGTGIAPRDRTPEALAPLVDRPLPGFGELFRWLSFQDIGPAAMLSRATAGVAGTTLVFALPGSPAGVRLALEKLILPELGHLASQAAGPGSAAGARPSRPQTA
jgi:molybdenum cofactor biosynthesis protein B